VPMVPLRSVFFRVLREHVDIVALWKGLGVRSSVLGCARGHFRALVI
jgi:hypothetical protein